MRILRYFVEIFCPHKSLTHVCLRTLPAHFLPHPPSFADFQGQVRVILGLGSIPLTMSCNPILTLHFQNLLVNDDGRGVVIDFGSAKTVDTNQTGTRVGTRYCKVFVSTRNGHIVWSKRWTCARYYMPPERLLGGKTTIQGDMYAFGMTCYQVGDRPCLATYRKPSYHFANVWKDVDAKAAISGPSR